MQFKKQFKNEKEVLNLTEKQACKALFQNQYSRQRPDGEPELITEAQVRLELETSVDNVDYAIDALNNGDEINTSTATYWAE